MIFEERTRSIIHCDQCPHRLDLGPAAVVTNHLRLPSGWLVSGQNRHLCPTCSRKVIAEMAALSR